MGGLRLCKRSSVQTTYGSKEQQEAQGIPTLPFSSFFFGLLITGFKKQEMSYPDYNHIFKAMLTYNQIITTGNAFPYPNRKLTCLLPDASFSRWAFQYHFRPSRSLHKNAPGTTVVDLRIVSGTSNQLIPCL